MKDVIPIDLNHLIKVGLILSALSLFLLVFYLPSSLIVTPIAAWFLLSLFGFLLIYPRISFYTFVISLFVAPILLNFIPSVSGLIIREMPLILVYLIVFLIICLRGKTKFRDIHFGLLEGLIFIVLAFMLLQAIRQVPLNVGLLGFKSMMYYSPVYFLTLILFNTKDKIKNLVNILLISGVLLALVSVLQYIFTQKAMEILGFETGELGYRTSMGYLKASATLGNPSAFAIIIAVVLFILFLLRISGNLKINRKLAIMAMMILALGLILSFSRITFIAIMLVFLLLAMIYKRKMINYFLLGSCFIIIVNIALNNFIFENLISSFGMGENVLGIKSTLERIEIIKKSFSLFSERPLFGWGLGVTGYPSLHFADALKSGYFSTDNFYLKLLVETGIIGILLFLLLLFVAISRGQRLYKLINDNYLKSMCLSLNFGLILIALVSVANTALELPVINSLFWMMLGLITACGIADKKVAEDGLYLAGGVHL